MLRGPQTAAELRQRSERLHRFESVPAVEEQLERLAGRELVELQARRPGEHAERWRHLLGGEDPSAEAARPAAPAFGSGGLDARIERIEEQLETILAALERGGLL